MPVECPCRQIIKPFGSPFGARSTQIERQPGSVSKVKRVSVKSGSLRSYSTFTSGAQAVKRLSPSRARSFSRAAVCHAAKSPPR